MFEWLKDRILKDRIKIRRLRELADDKGQQKYIHLTLDSLGLQNKTIAEQRKLDRAIQKRKHLRGYVV